MTDSNESHSYAHQEPVIKYKLGRDAQGRAYWEVTIENDDPFDAAEFLDGALGAVRLRLEELP